VLRETKRPESVVEEAVRVVQKRCEQRAVGLGVPAEPFGGLFERAREEHRRPVVERVRDRDLGL